jgi:hypothetical protein
MIPATDPGPPAGDRIDEEGGLTDYDLDPLNNVRDEVLRAGDDPARVEGPITREPSVMVQAAVAVYDRIRESVEVERVDPSYYEFGGFIPRKRREPSTACPVRPGWT